MTTYLVAAIKPWNIAAFHRYSPSLPGDWRLVERPEALTPSLIAAVKPRYVFFPHWSWIVRPEILDHAECVCFHAADVPYGRGGSPVQNLIARGFRETRLSALRMTTETDAGPVYLKRPMSLAGRGQEIFERMADLVWDMIAEIIAAEPVPLPQEGSAVIFSRRRPEQSHLPEDGTLATLYDHIRMLDVETYPPAFLDHGAFRLEFTHAMPGDGVLEARVRIIPKPSHGRTS